MAGISMLEPYIHFTGRLPVPPGSQVMNDIGTLLPILGVLTCGVAIIAVLLSLAVVLFILVIISMSHGKREAVSKGTRAKRTSEGVLDRTSNGIARRKSEPGKGRGVKGPLICFGTMVVLIVSFLVMATFTGVLVLTVREVMDKEIPQVVLVSMEPMNIEPLTTLEIVGSGFDPDGSAISVVLTNEFGIPFTAPVSHAEEDRVEVVVPPLTLPDGTSVGSMDVKVIQVTKDRVMVSNTLEGLEVGPIEVLESNMAPGEYTSLFLSMCLDCLDSLLMNSSYDHIQQPLLDHKGSIMDIKDELDDAIAKGSGNLDLSYDLVNLTDLGTLLHTMVGRTLGTFPMNSTDTGQTRADIEDPDRELRSELDQMRAVALKQQDLRTRMLVPGAKFAFGMFTTMACMVGGAGLTMSLAAGIALAVGTSWLMTLAAGERPTPISTLQTTLETIADTKLGVPLIGLVKDPLIMLKEFNSALGDAKMFREGEPSGGVVLTDLGGQRSDDMKVLYRKAPGTHSMRLSISNEQTTVPIRDAIPPVPPGRIAYSGNFDGSRTFHRTSDCSMCGPVVSRIDYYVSGSIELVGKVDEDGRMTGTLSVSGQWDVSGDGGCPHLYVRPASGPLSSSQSVSGRTSGFRAGSGGAQMVNGISGTMDPYSVYGEMSFMTTDGTFTISYELTPD